MLYENNFQNKNREKKWHCATFWQFAFMSGLAEDNWILISASVFNLFQSVVLIKACKEDPAPPNM